MVRHGWVLLLALLLVGCGTSYSKLKSESQVPELAALAQEGAARENHTIMVPAASPGSTPVRIAVHQFESPASDTLVVLVHGILADHSSWRFVAADLGRDHDLWLIDLPGCGDSDKPDPATVGEGDYSPTALAGRLLEVLRAQLPSRPEGSPVILGAHSLGGAIVMRMFADEGLRTGYADVLDRIDSLVLISPLDVAVHRPDPMIQEIATASGVSIRFGSALGVLRERVAAATLDSVVSRDRALREEADKRIEVLTDPARRRPMQAMLRTAVSWRNGRLDWDATEAVVAAYGHISPPTLILWGMRDETLPCSMGYKLARELPHADLVCIPRVMHSPHIEAPRLTARLIRQFIQTGKPPTLHEGHARGHGPRGRLATIRP